MKAKDLNVVRRAVRKNGDAFWKTVDWDGNCNDIRLKDVVTSLNKEGLDLKLIKFKKSAAGRSIRRRIKNG